MLLQIFFALVVSALLYYKYGFILTDSAVLQNVTPHWAISISCSVYLLLSAAQTA
jgi:hypothetical protein